MKIKSSETEILKNDTAEAAVPEKKKKKKHKLSIYDVTSENDMKYRGPLSYRGLKIIGWLSIVFSQYVVIMNIHANITASSDPVVFGEIGNSMIISLGLPLLLISNFSILLNGRNRYKQLLLINGSIALVISLFFLFLYNRYIIGILSLFFGGRPESTAFLDQLTDYVPEYKGYFTFNIYIDLFLCTLFMFFVDYKPKKIFTGRKIIIFRLFSVFPVLYEITCIVLKLLATDKKIVIPFSAFPFLSTKPPLSFLLFVSIIVFTKGREKRYLKHGKTHEEYQAFIRTNTNSFQFSRFLAKTAIIFGIADLIQVFILLFVFCSNNGVGFTELLEPANAAVFTSAVNWTTAWGAGDMILMITIIPVVLLFSYTRTTKIKIIDTGIPLVSILLIVLAYLEGFYRILQSTLGNLVF